MATDDQPSKIAEIDDQSNSLSTILLAPIACCAVKLFPADQHERFATEATARFRQIYLDLL
jgi:hypothetical protein